MQTMQNPVADIISDDLYLKLNDLGLIDEKGIRDYLIRIKFKEMRQLMAASEAIETLRGDYPYLQYDTIRKIVYQSRRKAVKL